MRDRDDRESKTCRSRDKKGWGTLHRNRDMEEKRQGRIEKA